MAKNKYLKSLSKYYSLLLVAILFIQVIIEYTEIEQIMAQAEKDGLMVDFFFNGWNVLFYFTIITILELSLKKKGFKLLFRIFLTLTIIGLLLKHHIPIDEFDSGIENTVAFLGFIAAIILLILGLKKLKTKLFKKKRPVANTQ